MTGERVLICGSRTWDDRASISEVIQGLPAGTVVIHGGAAGADSWAGHLAGLCGLEVEVYRADWSAHGKAAGPIRNQQMLTDGKPDRVIAFRADGPSRGTDDLVRRARAAGVPVLIYGPRQDGGESAAGAEAIRP